MTALATRKMSSTGKFYRVIVLLVTLTILYLLSLYKSYPGIHMLVPYNNTLKVLTSEQDTRRTSSSKPHKPVSAQIPRKSTTTQDPRESTATLNHLVTAPTKVSHPSMSSEKPDKTASPKNRYPSASTKTPHVTTSSKMPHTIFTTQGPHNTILSKHTENPKAQTPIRPRPTGLIVNSSLCHIPDFSPWDDTVLDVLKQETPLKECKKDHPVTLNQRGLQLFMEVHHSRLKSGCDPECCSRSVIRDKTGKSDDKFELGDKTSCFEGRTTLVVSDEFLKVTCFCKATPSVTLYEDFRAFILPKTHSPANPITPAKVNVNDEYRLNVYMIGLDSVSRLNFNRYMPKVQRYLEDELQAIPMQGLTKVGVNTFPNLLALLTGLNMDQMHQSLRETPFDRQPMIWRQFSSLGYTTLYTEDEPEVSTFNYRKKGFFAKPTDHYARPLYLAVQRSKFVSRGGDVCLNDRLHLAVQLQWFKDFISQPDPSPQFSLVFSNAPSHKGTLIYIRPLEPHLLQLLETYRTSRRYNSSILILFSDHGARFGPVMQTELGGYESRLPFFYVALPPWYEKRYPQRMTNLRVNSRRLTTFFDVHATLRDLLVDAGASRADLPRFPNPGVSLFQPVPQNRSCDAAGIAPHWCVCRSRQPLPLSITILVRFANATVEHINKVLLRRVRPKCAVLRLDRVTSAFLTVSETGGTVKDTSYRLEAFDEISLRIVTVPGEAEFEATVRCHQGVPPRVRSDSEFQESKLRLDGAEGLVDRCRSRHPVTVLDVSRLNMYRGQSDCLVNYFDERRFCYCKNLL